jgi:von Willebrand factor type A domain
VADGMATVLVAALVALAAAQPLLARSNAVLVRGDAEVYFVLDTSRSMLAAPSAGADTRFERARDHAGRLREELDDISVGVASLTDRLLPHLFPTSDRDEFAATIARAIGVDRPPPRVERSRSSEFAALAEAAIWNYFSENLRRRLLVVFTDGEGQPSDVEGLRGSLRSQPPVTMLFVHVWREGERVFGEAGPEPEYVPDPSSRQLLGQLAAVAGGRVFSDGEVGAVAAAVQRELGAGRRASSRLSGQPEPLAPYAVAFAFVPLAFLLWRRNRA